MNRKIDKDFNSKLSAIFVHTKPLGYVGFDIAYSCFGILTAKDQLWEEIHIEALKKAAEQLEFVYKNILPQIKAFEAEIEATKEESAA